MPDEISNNNALATYFFENEQQKICGHVVSSIVEDYIEDYPSIVERFFTRYYYIKSNVAYQVLFHTNRICLLSLAPEHPALTEGIAKISFDVGNIDRSKNLVRGKGKKGAMPLQADSTLALITTDNGNTYKVPAGVRGKLIEVNVELTENPKRLHACKEGEGYFAIILPKLEKCDELKESLLTQEQYEKYKQSLKSDICVFEGAASP